ncbi:MAG: diaminopimelate decarboxylase [Polyangiales bacterium]|jgi:diaminopimelate decarboxylase
MSVNKSTWTDRLDEDALASRTARLVQEGHLEGERSLFVHDLERMASQLAQLTDAFPSSALHAVAVKANPVLGVLRHLVSLGAGLECASHEEVMLALAAGCAPARVVFDSPAKTDEELAYALNLGIHLNLDNFEELRRVAQHVPTGGRPAGHVGLRINPQVGGGTIAATSVAGTFSKFGLPIRSRRAEIIDAFARYPWLDGLHVHVGSQGCSIDQLVAAVKIAWELKEEIESLRAAPVTELDIGGGLPVAYVQGDTPPELETYVAMLRAEVPGLFQGSADAAPPRLITELGRAIHAGSGFAVSRIEYLKEEEGKRVAVIHLGADAFMRPVYQPESWRHEFLVLTADGRQKTSDTLEPVTVVGPLCFGGDVLARDILLPALEPSDLLVVRDCGAYTLSLWSRHCNRGLPKVVGLEGTKIHVLKKRETAQDVVAFWS